MAIQCNVGSMDRKLRVIAGLVILAAGVYLQNPLGLIGLVPLATGLFRFCPAYLPLGISTVEKSSE